MDALNARTFPITLAENLLKDMGEEKGGAYAVLCDLLREKFEPMQALEMQITFSDLFEAVEDVYFQYYCKLNTSESSKPLLVMRQIDAKLFEALGLRKELAKVVFDAFAARAKEEFDTADREARANKIHAISNNRAKAKWTRKWVLFCLIPGY